MLLLFLPTFNQASSSCLEWLREPALPLCIGRALHSLLAGPNWQCVPPISLWLTRKRWIRSGLLIPRLPVGQSFVWHRRWLPDSSEEYSRAVRTAEASWVVCLRQSSTDLFFTAVHPTPEATSSDKELGLTRRWLEDYFQIQQYPALPALYEDWRTRDPVFFSKIELDQRTVGVRVLRQDPWECLVAYVNSSDAG